MHFTVQDNEGQTETYLEEWEISYRATNRKMSDTRQIKRASAQKMYIIERKNHRDSLIGIPSIILPPVSSMLSLIFPRHSS